MPVYVQPKFNLAVSIWRGANPPPAAPAVVCLGNLSPGKITGVPPIGANTHDPRQGGMWLRLPTGTDIRDIKNGGLPDVVEVPAGTGRMYTVSWVDDIGAGFANEHRFAILKDTFVWPLPFPSAGGGPSPPAPPIFSTAFQVQTAGVPAQVTNLPVAGGTTIADSFYLAAAVMNYTGGAPVYRFNAVVIAPQIYSVLPVVGGVASEIGIFRAPWVPGVNAFSVDFGFGFVGQAMLFAVLTLNDLPTLYNQNVNAGVGTPPVNVPVLFPGVALTPSLITTESLELDAAGGLPLPLVAPVVDFAVGMTELVLALNCKLSFGGDTAPVPGAYTATRNSVASGNTWRMIIDPQK